MIRKTIIILIGVFLLIYFKQFDKVKHEKELTIGGLNFKLINYQNSQDGTILFTPNLEISDQGNKGYEGHAIALRTDGSVLFNRTYYNKKQRIHISNFRFSNEGYYWTSGLELNGFYEGKINFLNMSYKDVLMPPVIPENMHLDVHDFLINEMQEQFAAVVIIKTNIAATYPEIRRYSKNGDLLFSWSSFDHKNELITEPNDNGGRDPLHINKIFALKNFLYVSFRGTSQIVKIDMKTGKVCYVFSAKNWTFLNDKYNGFKRQHSVNVLENGNILLFDNGDKERGFSRGVEYAIDEKNKVAKLVWESRRFYGYFTRFGGSVQRLTNGNTIVGWGSTEEDLDHNNYDYPIFTEFNNKGDIIRELLSRQKLYSMHVFFKPEH